MFLRFRDHRFFSLLFAGFAVLGAGIVLASDVRSQGSANEFGNGGRHTIQGRLYLASGRRSDIQGLRVRVVNFGSGEFSVITDSTGTFVFKNLNSGTYTVTVEGGEFYEDYRESVVIDDPGSSAMGGTVRMRGAPRIANVQIYLRPRAASATDGRASVINAKWARIPKAAIEQYERGVAAMRTGNDGEAEAAFRKTVEISPVFAPAHVGIGVLEQKTGRHAASAASLARAIQHDATNFDAHLNLGVAFMNLKKYKESEAELVTAAHLNRAAITPHYYLGVLFVVQNNLDIARKAFETAREMKGGNNLPAIHKYLGRIYSAKKMKKEAIQELERYLSIAPTAKDAAKVRQDITEIKVGQD